MDTAETARHLGYLPPTSPNGAMPWTSVTMRHLVARSRADGQAGGPWAVDTLFPATLEGQLDISAVDEGTAAALYGLVRLLAPRVVLETGTHQGRSTREIARALRDNAEWELVPASYRVSLPPGHGYTVDLHDYGLRTSGALLPGTEVFITAVIGRTPEILQQPPLADLQGIDFAFLDGDHSPEGLQAELAYLEAHRAAECWVAIDNSRDSGWPDVARVLQASAWPRVSFGSCTGLDLLWMHEEDARGR